MSTKKTDNDTVTAAIVVIGDEILSGKTDDKNVAYIAHRLEEVGINLKHVRVVPDEEKEIVRAVNETRREYDYVFTTGGIGPTHDDITSQSVAKAFGVQVNRNKEATERLKQYYGVDDFTEGRKRMADMPYGVTLIDNPISIAPGFIIENVHVMAGVPEIMQAMFEGIIDTLRHGKKIRTKTITCQLREGQVSTYLAAIQKKHERVKIGSYPFFRGGKAGVSLVLKGYDEIQMQKAINDVRVMIEELSDKDTGEPLIS